MGTFDSGKMSQPAKKTVELFYDVISPYTWIAFETLCRYRAEWDLELKFKPFLIGAVMGKTGNQSPAMIPAKGAYGQADLHRARHHYQIPFNRPSDFMDVMFNKGSMLPMRFVTAVEMRHPQYTEAVSRELWMRIWSRDQDATIVESLRQVGMAAGMSFSHIEDCLFGMKQQPIKDKLKHNTDEAIELGAFGSPTIIVKDGEGKKQLIFGSDRMHYIADILGKEYVGPLREKAAYKSKL